MENNIFPNVEQEAQRAADELQEIKVHVKELLGKLTQIEKRLKVIAPEIKTEKVKTKFDAQQVFSDEFLREKYEMLVNEFKDDLTVIEKKLQLMHKEELLALVKYLGCSVTKNPSEKKLVELALGRLKESKLLRG